jgi:hypothetical protein
MRTLRAAIFVVLFVLLMPARAHAWWDWLDQLSGPGPFWGWDLQYRVICIKDTDQDGADVRLTNIKDSGLQRFARFAGVGCVFDKDKNPVASLNVTVGQFYAFKNDIQPDKTRDRVTMTRFEPSFSVFVDRQKIVELQSGLGMMIVHGPAFDHFERFYWKPIQLNITPVASKNVRGPTFGIGVIIIPAGFDASNFGATGTFHTDKDVLTTASVTWDFGRTKK